MTEPTDRERMRAGIRALLASRNVVPTGAERAAEPLPNPTLSGRRLALSVRCPFPSCHAEPGRGCQLAKGRPMTGLHDGRMKLAVARQAAARPAAAPTREGEPR